jgi:hypothetical protein
VFDEQVSCNPAGEYAEMKHAVEKKFLGNTIINLNTPTGSGIEIIFYTYHSQNRDQRRKNPKKSRVS